MSKELVSSFGYIDGQPIGVSGFPGRGSDEGKGGCSGFPGHSSENAGSVTWFERYRASHPSRPASPFIQLLPNEAEWLSRGLSISSAPETSTPANTADKPAE